MSVCVNIQFKKRKKKKEKKTMTDVIMVDGSVGASNNSNLPLNMNNSVISVTMAAAAAAAAAAGGTGTTSPTLGGTSPVSAAAAAAAMMMMQPPASCSSSSSSSSSSTSAAAIAAAAAAAAANTQSVADYLAQLLKDKKQLAALPNVFHHVERLLDEGKTKKHSDLSDLHVWLDPFLFRFLLSGDGARLIYARQRTQLCGVMDYPSIQDVGSISGWVFLFFWGKKKTLVCVP